MYALSLWTQYAGVQLHHLAARCRESLAAGVIAVAEGRSITGAHSLTVLTVETHDGRCLSNPCGDSRTAKLGTRACGYSSSTLGFIPNHLNTQTKAKPARFESSAAMSEFLVNLLGERLVNGEKAEVDVHALGSKLSLLGLYFGCSLNGPCKQFNASLCEFYSKFKKSSEHKDKLEIVFISSDQDQKQWQDFLQEMQWPALPFKDRHKKVR